MIVFEASAMGSFLGIAAAWPHVAQVIAIPYAAGLATLVIYDWVKR